MSVKNQNCQHQHESICSAAGADLPLRPFGERAWYNRNAGWPDYRHNLAQRQEEIGKVPIRVVFLSEELRRRK